MYHNIDNPPPGARTPNLYVTPRMFKMQMRYLNLAGFKVLSVQDMLSAVEAGEVAHNMVAITFDDGCADFYRNAYPVLKHFGYPSTVYIVSGLVGTYNKWDARDDNYVKPLMDWKTLVEIRGNGVQIGSHSKTHPHLTSLSDDTLKEELLGSKRDLENRLNQSIDHFCYPYGDHNDSVKEQVGKAGYRYAVITQRGHVARGNDPLVLRRIPIKLITNPLSFMYKIHTDSEIRKGKKKDMKGRET